MALPERIDSTAALPDTFSVADMHWWTVYTDTILQNLITQTLEHNKDMLAASARIKELAALRRVDISKILPQINGRLYADKDATNYGGDDYSNAIMMGQVRRIIWTEDGWPLVLPECYGAVPQAPISEDELIGAWEHIALDYAYQHQDGSSAIILRTDHTVGGAPFEGERWSFDAAKNILTIGSAKLYVAREADWETSPRKATLVYAGLDGRRTLWGKKSQPQITIGATDNSASFWTAFSPYYTIDGGEGTFSFAFTNHTDRANVWDNWILAITNGVERGLSGYKEYAVIRADAYGWGDFATEAQRNAGMAHDYDMSTFAADMDGANVSLNVTISGGKMEMKAITTTTDGRTFTYTYTVSGLPAGAKGAFLTTEKGHLVLSSGDCHATSAATR